MLLLFLLCGLVSSYSSRSSRRRDTNRGGNTNNGRNNNQHECDVGILGGGIGGLYSAYTLSNERPDLSICIFEKNDYWGGRLKDFQSDVDPQQNWIPLGGIRIDDLHEEAKYLYIDELGIDVQFTEYLGQLINLRGQFFDDSTAAIAAYPTLNQSLDEDTLILELLSHVDDDFDNLPFTTIQAFMIYLFGSEGYQYLQETFRFRADYKDNDLRSYIEFLANDYYNSSFPSYTGYPEGGLSEGPRRIISYLETQENVELYLNEKVLSIETSSNRRNNDKQYIITTNNNNEFTFEYVIIDIQPLQFAELYGDIANQIQSLQPFIDSKPISVMIVQLIYSTRWWENAYQSKSPPIRRIWTTESCINFIELPITDYGTSGTLGRARMTFADDYCSQYWKTLFERFPDNDEKIMLEIQRYLQDLFPDVTVPREIDYGYQYWDGGWHFQYPNAELGMREIAQWAKEPLEGENVMLVGEAWNIYRSWMEGAIRSAQFALERHFQVEF